jgi:hypothetical protein
MSAFQNGAPPARVVNDDSDVEEEALVADYREQVQYEDGMEELEPVTSLTMAQQTDDIQSRLAAAALFGTARGQVPELRLVLQLVPLHSQLRGSC